MSLGNEKAICGLNEEVKVDFIEKMKMEERFKRGMGVRQTDN